MLAYIYDVWDDSSMKAEMEKQEVNEAMKQDFGKEVQERLRRQDLNPVERLSFGSLSLRGDVVTPIVYNARMYSLGYGH